jgi:AraC-like DNA-binding protein
MAVLTARGSWVLPPHRALWIPSGLSHGLKLSAVIELRTLYLSPQIAALPDWQTCQVIDVPPLTRELILAIARRHWDSPATDAELRLEHVLLDRLQTTYQQPVHLPDPQDQRGKRYAEHLYANPAERRPLAAIAREIGASPRTLERAFKAELGMTVGAWTQQLRLVFALERLAAGHAVGDVAFAVGYANPSSFIAVFRRAFGTTPSAYFDAPTAAQHRLFS